MARDDTYNKKYFNKNRKYGMADMNKL